MPANPYSLLAADGWPLYELKMGLVLYLAEPPGPTAVRQLYDLWLPLAGPRLRFYRSTREAAPLLPWTPTAQQYFETRQLPDLRKRADWGYVLSDYQKTDSWLFLFHGARPQSEAGRASVYRFDFDWTFSPDALRDFAATVIRVTPCLSGFGGPFFQGRPAYGDESFNPIFGLARRYWGIEAHDLDRTALCVQDGFKCVNWLTILGDRLRQADPAALDQARAAAFAFHETPHAILLQAEAKPRYIDRNRREALGGYAAVAQALLPLQMQDHPAFPGSRWTAENTANYLRRFTHPGRVF